MDVLKNSMPLLERGLRAPAASGTAMKVADGRRAELVGLAAIFAQVALIALIMREVGLDPLALRRIVYIVAGAFVVNHLLPPQLRPRFFATVSICALVVILGGTIGSRVPDLALGLMRTGTILGAGAILIGICHLPLGFWSRAALLAAAGGVIAWFRAGSWNSGDLAIVWPVLASMFMFRVAVYLYDRATAPVRAARAHTVSYFFLAPNVASLLFPVIDFRTYCQKYYDEDALAIYQRGVHWMGRGVLHLLLYRIVDRLFMLEAASVSNGAELAQFVVANLFLYLKVSGGFHLAIGMLLLFGYNLPETNHRYFLAASFTDYWRRVNIYWRNFIMKVVYYPTFFRFKSWGQTRALVVATLWAFFVTWALHLYQTWWIKGTVSWSWPDTLFWTSLALLVLVNSLWELKRNRQRKLNAGTYTWREAAGLAVRTAATFAVIAVLWSLWSTPTLGLWVRMWSLADASTAVGSAIVLLIVMAATVLCEVLPSHWRRTGASRGETYVRSRRFRFDVLQCAMPLLLIVALAHPRVQSRLAGSGTAVAADLNAWFRVVSEKDSEARGQGRGYYENLTAVDASGGQYFETMHAGQRRRYAQPTIEVPGVHFRELAANTQFTNYDWSFTTNRWGMRDRDYALVKPAGATRIAVLGSSQVMGFGLPDDELFESIIERRLNRDHPRPGGFELMNFAVGGLSPLGQVWLLRERVARFAPDIVIFVSHPNDFDWSNRDLVRMVRKRMPLPATLPTDLLAGARVTSTTPEAFAVTRLRPFEADILAACYRSLAAECRALGALPVHVFVPVPTELPLDEAKTAKLRRLADEAGFVGINLATIFLGRDPEEMALPDHGRHINAAGNVLIADALLERLVTEPRIDLLNRATSPLPRAASRFSPTPANPLQGMP